MVITVFKILNIKTIVSVKTYERVSFCHILFVYDDFEKRSFIIYSLFDPSDFRPSSFRILAFQIFDLFHFPHFDLFNFRPFSGCHSQRRDREGQGRSKAGQTSRRRNFSRRIHRRFCLQRWTSNSFLRIFVKFKFPFCILRLKHV